MTNSNVSPGVSTADIAAYAAIGGSIGLVVTYALHQSKHISDDTAKKTYIAFTVVIATAIVVYACSHGKEGAEVKKHCWTVHDRKECLTALALLLNVVGGQFEKSKACFSGNVPACVASFSQQQNAVVPRPPPKSFHEAFGVCVLPH